MLIAVVNQSSVVDAHSAQRMVTAVARQVRLHVAPHLGRSPVPVILYSHLDEIPDGAMVVALLDDADQAGVLGYHDETPDGRSYAKVFAREVTSHGGTLTVGALSVSVTLSHEVIEMLWDPSINLWADDGDVTEIAVEACDPVEGDSYNIKGVAVSNFVLPAYFDVQDQAGPWDYLDLLSGPWAMTPGGYLLTRRAGRIQQEFGAKFPDWKIATKSFVAARTARRKRRA